MWCEGLTHWKRPWCWERLKVWEGDDRGWGGCMASLARWTWAWASSGDGQGSLACCSPWVAKSQTQLSDWTELELVNSGFSFLSLSLFIYKMSMIIVSITYQLGKITYGKCLTQGLTYKNAQKCFLLLSVLTFWCIPLLLDIVLYTVG